MNEKQATAKFSLNVHSSSYADVWPLEARHHPKIDDRIRESYYADEDEASASFEITSIEDLAEIMKFYDGRSVRMSLGVTVDAPEFSTSAALTEKFPRGIYGSFRALQADDLSPATAASKIIAIAHSLSRWEQKNAK